MSALFSTIAISLSVILSLLMLLWIVATIRGDVSIVDPCWGAGFVIVAWLAVSWNSSTDVRPMLLTILTTIWGLRLSLFLLWRNWGHDEDRRYQAMRNRHGRRFWWISLFTVFLLQGIILWFVSFPIQAIAAAEYSKPLHWLDALGTFLWSVGLLFESVGDWQLAVFQSEPSNSSRVMDRGLWRYTRHPNYFGDFCVWWGIYLIAAAGGGWWSIVSPLLMSFLLMKISGVALLESTIADRRPEYAAYRARTNAFFPGPTRNE